MRIAIVGPVYPYRAGIAYCTTRLAEELRKSHDVDIVSFSRQYPKRFYPGGDDIDETLRDKTPSNAHFILDVVNPLTWLAAGVTLRRERYDAVILVWWIWVWALPYLVLQTILSRRTRVVLQCHNIGDKEPAWWKRLLTNRVLKRADALVVHAKTEAAEGWRRSGGVRTVQTFLPVHELGGAVPSREEARNKLGVTQEHVALCFGHVRPFKGVDIAIRAWADVRADVLLLVAGEVWWEGEREYRKLAERLPEPQRHRVRFDFRFIPDAEIADYFAAADVVLAPYRVEAQSGVALTAFHFARPVIASRVGGLPEIVEQGVNGILIPPEDSAALARAIDELFIREDRQEMERAAARSAQRYSWEEYAQVFGRLVEGTK